MRNISRGEGPKKNHQERAAKKRKYQSSEKTSVQAAAQEFLEKAAREILGHNDGGVKGPMQINNSEDGDDDEELPVS